MPDAALAALRAMLPAGVAVAAADPRARHAPLPEEAIAGAPRRLAEFAAGRVAARAAMAALGLPPAAIRAAPDRAPVWPAGVIGSITHTADIALAAVARRGDLRALGLDAEGCAAVEPALWPTICRPEELAALHRLPEAARIEAATRLFCAKEATYKAQYPLTGLLFDFHRLSVGFEGARFTARFAAPTGPFAQGDTLGGRTARAGGLMLAVVAIAQAGS